MRTPRLLITLIAFAITANISAVQSLVNGNFETFNAGLPASWTYGAGDGSASQSAESSPFTNVHPTGVSSVLLTDGPAANTGPSLEQLFSPATGNVLVSFEFKLNTLAGDPWALSAGDYDNSSITFLTNYRIGGSSGNFSLGDISGIADILALSPGTWYQVSSAFDLASHTYSGSITPFGGGATTWSNRSTNSSVSELDYLSFDDIFTSAITNGSIIIDNLSVTPEPGRTMLGFIGLVFVLLRRKRMLPL